MTQTKFTPAPWNAFRCNDGSLDILKDNAPKDDWLIGHVGTTIYTNSIKGAEALANANLIASAPEMYEALEKLEGLLSYVNQFDGKGNRYGDYRDIEYIKDKYGIYETQIAQLLKKARGE